MGIVRIRWSFVSLMRRGGVLPSNYTFPFVLKACASDSEPLARGWEVVHGETIEKTGFESDMYVEAGLVDAYAKRGQISYARKVFDGMTQRNLAQESLMLFCTMQREESLSPDPVAGVSVATAVGQVGDIKHLQLRYCGMFESHRRLERIEFFEGGGGDQTMHVLEKFARYAGIYQVGDKLDPTISCRADGSAGKAIAAFGIVGQISIIPKVQELLLDKYERCAN
ncbi:pentatricopeptide repeat-containing protein At3g22690-like [Syzygium oleosum]|uniref:pentatricopeptide repeat-containing protein At3g22690-like n=1 Tax=Syzygium oleosum TaxID=219896 RepID=UPI0011D20737|nr:pentatricopeptide repeat-containing protein At3g22690-like [Syzygium oleosum]